MKLVSVILGILFYCHVIKCNSKHIIIHLPCDMMQCNIKHNDIHEIIPAC